MTKQPLNVPRFQLYGIRSRAQSLYMRSNLILFVLVLVLALVLANQNFTGYKGEDEDEYKYDDEGSNFRAEILLDPGPA